MIVMLFSSALILNYNPVVWVGVILYRWMRLSVFTIPLVDCPWSRFYRPATAYIGVYMDGQITEVACFIVKSHLEEMLNRNRRSSMLLGLAVKRGGVIVGRVLLAIFSSFNLVCCFVFCIRRLLICRPVR